MQALQVGLSETMGTCVVGIGFVPVAPACREGRRSNAQSMDLRESLRKMSMKATVMGATLTVLTLFAVIPSRAADSVKNESGRSTPPSGRLTR